MSDAGVAHICQDRLRQARSARAGFEPDWFLNLSFFEGQQWVAYDGRGLYRPNLAGRLALTDNRIRPIIRTEVAKLTKQRPSWAAAPRAVDDQAVQDAQTGERLLTWGYDHLAFAESRREGITWSRICGSGFTKVTWDPTLGGGVEVWTGPDGKPVKGPKGRAMRVSEFPELGDELGAQKTNVGGGDVRIDTRSPFDIYPDPLASTMKDCRWLIDESVRSPDYIKERYGKTVEPDAPAPVGVTQTRFHSHAQSASGTENVGVRVFEMWEKPCKETPAGRHVVWCNGGGVLYEGPNPYGCLPYAMWTGIPVPGRFWPDAVITDLRPIQVRLNKLISQISENVDRFGNPAILIDRLANVQYHGVPGEQILYQGTTQTAVPQFLNPPQMPQHVFQLVQQMESALREISGQFEVSQGTVPAGVTAASAISLLQEQDATRLGPDVEAVEVTIGEIGQMVLKLMATYYKTERIVVIVGEDGLVDMDSYRASTSFQIPNVTVQAGSTFPRSIAARQAAIRDVLNMMLQYGVPVSADALARTLRDMQVGGLERLVQGFVVDQQAVAREQLDFLRGNDPALREIDNDEVHIAGHEEFAKSARFLNLPPKRQAVLIEHIRAHKDQLAQEQADAAPPAPAGAPAPQAGLPGLPAGPDTLPTEPSGNPAAMLVG